MSLFENVVDNLNLEKQFSLSCKNAYDRIEKIEAGQKINKIEKTYNIIINEKDNFYTQKEFTSHNAAFEYLKPSLISLLQYQQKLNNLYIKMSQNDNTYRSKNNLYKLDFNFNNKDYINVPDLETMLKSLSEEKQIENIDNILNNITLTKDIQNITRTEKEQKLMLFSFFEYYYSICFCINILHYFILNLTDEEIKLSYMNTMINLYHLILPNKIPVNDFDEYKNSIQNFITNFMNNTELTDQDSKDIIFVVNGIVNQIEKDNNGPPNSQFMTSFDPKTTGPIQSTLVSVDSSDDSSDNDDNVLSMIGSRSGSPNNNSNNQSSQKFDPDHITQSLPVIDVDPNSDHEYKTSLKDDDNNNNYFSPLTMVSSYEYTRTSNNINISKDLQIDTRIKYCLPILYEDIKQSNVKPQINNYNELCKLIDDIFTPTTMP